MLFPFGVPAMPGRRWRSGVLPTDWAVLSRPGEKAEEPAFPDGKEQRDVAGDGQYDGQRQADGDSAEDPEDDVGIIRHDRSDGISISPERSEEQESRKSPEEGH